MGGIRAYSGYSHVLYEYIHLIAHTHINAAKELIYLF